MCVHRFDYSVPEFANDFNMSDILICSDLAPATATKARFVRGDYEFTPRMFSVFHSHENIGLYFEVYDLALDQNGHNHYKVTVSLGREGEEGKKALNSMQIDLIKSDL